LINQTGGIRGALPNKAPKCFKRILEVMTRKIIIPAPGAWPAFDTSVGIAQELLNKGDAVEFLLCSGNKVHCPANPFINTLGVGQITCSLCKLESRKKLSKLRNTDKLKISPLADGIINSQLVEKEYFDSDNQKMSFSSLQTTLAQTKISGSGKEVDLFVSIMRQNKSSLAIAENLLALTTKNDELVIFNGRICGFYPFVRASEKSGRNYYCFEHPDSGNGAFVLANSVVHDPVKFADQIYEYYKSTNADDSTSLEYGRTWINTRKSGLSKDKNAYFSRRHTNAHIYFEEQLFEYDRTFSFFVSSEFEVDFIADILYFGYRSQMDFVNDFIGNYLGENEAFIIRMHPNMVNTDQSFRDEFYDNVNRYQKKNVFLVRSDENISSLKCVELSDIVFGFSSTVCIEAALLGKPVISLCNRSWSKFSFDYELVDLKYLRELISLIERQFCKIDTELKAARFIHTMHKSFGKNQLVSSAKSQFFANRKSHIWFRLLNYIYTKRRLGKK